MRRRWWNSFKIAFSMYSRIPMPQSEWTRENKSYAMCFFPWIGAVIGGLTWGVYHLWQWTLRQGVSFGDFFFPVLLMLVPVVVTGGIHLDGFLDTQDALSSWRSKEQRLEILKDPHAGAFAIISACVYFLLYLGIYSALEEESVKVICLSFVISRTLSGISVLRFPQARAKGLVADFAAQADRRACFRVLVVYLILTGGTMLFVGRLTALITLAVAGVCFFSYYRMCRDKFGGVTGDLAGHFLQVCELAMAFAAVVAARV